jgi:hypothetical protein
MSTCTFWARDRCAGLTNSADGGEGSQSVGSIGGTLLEMASGSSGDAIVHGQRAWSASSGGAGGLSWPAASGRAHLVLTETQNLRQRFRYNACDH